MANNSQRAHLRVRALCEGAIMVALAQVLSYLKLMELPYGGSLTRRCSRYCSLPSAGGFGGAWERALCLECYS